jgi:hypothetical protein
MLVLSACGSGDSLPNQPRLPAIKADCAPRLGNGTTRYRATSPLPGPAEYASVDASAIAVWRKMSCPGPLPALSVGGPRERRERLPCVEGGRAFVSNSIGRRARVASARPAV